MAMSVARWVSRGRGVRGHVTPSLARRPAVPFVQSQTIHNYARGSVDFMCGECDRVTVCA